MTQDQSARSPEPWTFERMREANAKAGGYFWSANTVRSFDSRDVPPVYEGPGGIFFVVDVANFDGTGRCYLVHEWRPCTSQVFVVTSFPDEIDSGGGEWPLDDKAQALDVARDLAALEPKGAR